MSKTDKDRPEWVQGNDLGVSGWVCHDCRPDESGYGHRGQRRKQGIHVTLCDEAGQRLYVKRRRGQGSWAKFLQRQIEAYGAPLEIANWARRKSEMPAWFGECDYDRHRRLRTKQEYDQRRCCRLPDRRGDRSLGGAVKNECKRRRRKIRQRERQQLWLATRMGREAEFDLLPIREDAHTILFDLT